jgi:two-component system, OmpR family, sensor histidine kinase KdpD
MAEHDDAARPAPERLLAEAQASELPPRGKLKILLGAAPGVGKTYRMLEVALARLRNGHDVVAGVVLTHGRVETEALLQGVPRLEAVVREHRGIALEEFDLDAALARRPELLLVDELAHTNAPGSRHVKRWQDVEELLESGVDVCTTLNVQHVESLHDVVERLTGVPVHERIPDEFIDRADEIELVDLPIDELLERLRAGKVYLGDQAARAEANFFRPATLSGLRELALRLVADRVRAASSFTARAATGRLLVAVSGSPFSARLLRSARRMAESLNVEWLALHVLASEGLVLSDAERRRLGNHLRLAEQLGAEVHTVTGRDVVGEILAFARRHDVRHIVVGKPLGQRLRDRPAHSFVNDLVRRSGDIDLVVVNGEETEEEPERAGRAGRHDALGYLVAVGTVAVATAICLGLSGWLGPVNLSMVYLLAVVAMAARGRPGPAVAASLLGVAAFDFLFIPPKFSFTVGDSEYLLTFLAMLLVGLVVSMQSARLRALVDAALRRAETSDALHRLSGDLATTRGLAPLAQAARRRCRDLLGVPVRLLVRGGAAAETGDALLEEAAPEEGAAPLAPDEVAVARWVLDHGEPAGAGTATLPGAKGLHVPLSGTRFVVGVLVCEGMEPARFSDPDERRLIESLARVIGLALEVERLAAEALEASVAISSERLKSALLASVSHDLRTPLQVITGAATALAESQASLDPMTRAELANGIAEEAEGLNQVVTNLLDVSRLESGEVRLKTQPHEVEDLFATAIGAMERRLMSHPTAVEVEPGCPPVAVDPVLFQSVLVNLLDNGAKYTPVGTPLSLLGRRAAGSPGGRVELIVADRGPGLAAGELESIFGKFVRGSTHASQRGVGLGLTICKRIVEAHGGTIRARSRDGGGAEFVIALPAVATHPGAET